MRAVLISTKWQLVLPVAVRKPLGLTPGMRVNIRVEGKGARITAAPAKEVSTLRGIQEILRYSGPKVPVQKMRVTNYPD